MAKLNSKKRKKCSLYERKKFRRIDSRYQIVLDHTFDQKMHLDWDTSETIDALAYQDPGICQGHLLIKDVIKDFINGVREFHLEYYIWTPNYNHSFFKYTNLILRRWSNHILICYNECCGFRLLLASRLFSVDFDHFWS